MVAGNAAARTINGFFEGENDLQFYDSLWKKYLYQPLMNAYFLKNLWDKFSDSDKRISRILSFATNSRYGENTAVQNSMEVKLISYFVPILRIFV